MAIPTVPETFYMHKSSYLEKMSFMNSKLVTLTCNTKNDNYRIEGNFGREKIWRIRRFALYKFAKV